MAPTDTNPPPAASDIPEPPWRTPRPRPAGRTTLSRDAIIDAAITIIDRDGLDAVSMRAVAAELGAGAASLYWHITNKEDLYDHILDRVIGEIPIPHPPDPANWQTQLTHMARDARTVLSHHPGVARLSFGRIPTGPHMLAMTEGMLAILRTAGIPDDTAAYAADLIALYITAHVYEEHPGTPPPDTTTPDHTITQIADYLSHLPPDRFPHITHLTHTGHLMNPDTTARFNFGLHILIAGLATTIPTT